MPLLDTRHMLAPLPAHDHLGQPTGYPQRLTTADDIEAHWQAWGDNRTQHRMLPFETAPGRSKLHRSNATVDAYVSDGRWVADCPGGPTGKCAGGMACWPEHERTCCLDCGTVYRVRFPAAHEIREATEVLEARPPEARHWHPHRDETVSDLKRENVTRGYGLTAAQEISRTVGQLPGAEDEAAELARKLLQMSPARREQILRAIAGQE